VDEYVPLTQLRVPATTQHAQAHTSGMTLAWSKMTYTRFRSKTLKHSTQDLIPLENFFMYSFKSPTCKSYHSKIISNKIYLPRPRGPQFWGSRSRCNWPSDQVIGVQVKKFQSIARKHVSNHFLYNKKSSKMQFSMILAKLKFFFSHFGFCTLYCKFIGD
jgi:hypothetical protein